jgi:hypothetical protein
MQNLATKIIVEGKATFKELEAQHIIMSEEIYQTLASDAW